MIGFWYADGNINCWKDPRRQQSYKKTVSFFNTDLDVLQKIKKLLGGSLRELKGNRLTKKPCYKLTISSTGVFDLLFEMTGTTSKSKDPLQLPDIPNSVFRHFLRGFMDGDGSIFFKTYKTRHGKLVQNFGMSFTSGLQTGCFLEEIRDRILQFIPVFPRKVVASKTNRKLPFSQTDSYRICEWLYEGATIYMERKMNIFLSVDRKKVLAGEKFRKPIPGARGRDRTDLTS